jgi:multicomponent Na+:H+ antiporter subunit F
MALAIAAVVVAVSALALVRVFSGPTLHDRLLAFNALLVRSAIIVACLAVAARSANLLDGAFALVLAGVVFSVAALKFFSARSFQPPMASAEERR